MYELSNKSIVISPRKSINEKMKSLLPGFMLTLVGTFAIFVYEKIRNINPTYESMNSIVSERVVEGAAVFASKSGGVVQDSVGPAANILITNGPGPFWIWFLAGGLIALFIFSIVNWRKL